MKISQRVLEKVWSGILRSNLQNVRMAAAKKTSNYWFVCLFAAGVELDRSAEIFVVEHFDRGREKKM